MYVLCGFLKPHSVITPSQYGVCQSLSTLDMSAKLNTDIKAAFARKYHTVAVFFDVEKLWYSLETWVFFLPCIMPMFVAYWVIS